MMKISDFEKYIALYGADLSRWPQHQIRPAIDLIQRDPAAGKIFSSAEKLDQMLRHYPSATVNVNALTKKIVQQANGGAKHSVVRQKPSVFNPAYLLVPGGGLLVAAVLGFMIGFHTMTETKQALMLDSVFYAQDHGIDDSEEAS